MRGALTRLHGARAAAFAIVGAAVLATAAPATGAAQTAALRVLDVDAAKVVGTVRSLQGVAGIPSPGTVEGTERLPDVIAHWREFRVDFVRSFDWRARLDTVDNPRSLFPTWSADPDDPRSYNFAASDAWVRSVRSLGADVLFTLASEIPYNAKPAADLAKYEHVVKRIVEHYVTGWGGGMKNAVRWWEFSDQPDFFKTHFAGTPDQFHAMYGAVARAVKAVDPTLQVGGPNLAFPLNEDAPYREGLFDYVRAQKLPFDFVSYIWFADATRDPLEFTRVARAMQTVLDAKGMNGTKQVLASFNMTGIADAKPDPVETAIYQAAALVYLQDAPVERAVLFRADTGWDPYHRFRDPAGVFGLGGEVDARARAFALQARMQATPRRVAIGGGDDKGYAVLAGRSEAGDLVQVLVVNYAIPAPFLAPTDKVRHEFILPLGPERAKISFQLLKRRGAEAAATDDGGYDLTVRNLPWGAKPFTVTRYRVDAVSTGVLFGRTRESGGQVRLKAAMAVPSVELIELRVAR